MEMSPEQAKALEEKIKNMSPEQLKEFQKQQCIFCHIIAGKVQSKKVYEDEKVLAILDINPANPGHILLIPKEHYQIMPLIPDEEVGYLFIITKAISHSLLRALKASGTNIFVANGIVAGQRAQHFMIHVIPRKEEDGLKLGIPENPISDKELADIKRILTKKINEIFGIKDETEEEVEIIKPKKTVAKTEEEMLEKKETKKEHPQKEKSKAQPKKIDLDQITDLLRKGT
jgi:histidine triad (HIT) family protein